MGELQAGTGARDQTRGKYEIAIGADRARSPQLLASVQLAFGVPICSLNCGLLSDDGLNGRNPRGWRLEFFADLVLGSDPKPTHSRTCGCGCGKIERI